MSSRRSGGCVITAAIVILCLAFVVVLTLGFWYVVNNGRTCDDDGSRESSEKMTEIVKVEMLFVRSNQAC